MRKNESLSRQRKSGIKQSRFMKRLTCFLYLTIMAVEGQAQFYTPVWMQRYNGAAHADDRPKAIAIDSAGNVIVTGYSYNSGSGEADFVTIKYSSLGISLWTNRYNGPANGNDQAVAITSCANGDVAVAGFSLGVGTGNDFTTLKYASDGTPLWTNRYNGLANGDDKVVSVAVNTNGDVVVTGHSQGSGSGYDFAAVKYASSGIPLWTNRYNGIENLDDSVTAMAIDKTGNVAITGYSQQGSGLVAALTISLSADGVPLWTNRFRRPGSVSNQHAALAVDSHGAVIVTGSSYISGFDCLTIKYSDSGVPLWTNVYQGPTTSAEYGSAIVVGHDDTTYVAGYTTNYAGPSGQDFLTIAYSRDGVSLWTNSYSSDGKFSDRTVALALGGDDRLYVTGYTVTNASSGANYDFLTIAYSLTGLPLWTNRFSGSGIIASDDVPAGIAVDPGKALFVTGYSWQGISPDYLTIKYSVLQPAPLMIQSLAGESILTWTNAAFGLQTAPAITGTFTNLPGATSPYTNPISGAQQFFRLISN